MKESTAFLIGIHPYAFRCGEAAEITGVKLVKPTPKSAMRPCLEIKFRDEVFDYVPISEVYTTSNYKIVSFGELVANGVNI